MNKLIAFLYLRFRRLRRLHAQQLILLLAVVVGLLSGLSAVFLKSIVHILQDLLRLYQDQLSYMYYVAPVCGVLIAAWITRRFIKERTGHGMMQLLYDISKNHAFIARKRSYAQFLTSTVTVGLGGSVGLEAPGVVTGAGIASNIARWIHLGYRSRLLLIGCGAAGAISGIFNSPIAGALFAIEVILIDVTIFQFIPVLISSVVGAVVAQTLLGNDLLFSFTLKDVFLKQHIPYYMLLGVICGLISLYFMRISFWVEGQLSRIKTWGTQALVGGACLALLIALLPSLYGEGYDMIKALLNGEERVLFTQSHENEISSGWLILLFFFLILILKPIATALTIGAGGTGGIFAPSLFLGAVSGYFFARTLNFIWPTLALSTSNFTLAGMSAVMSGILHAPLTAIFLIAEITGSYEMFIPLTIAASIGFLTILYFEKYSFYSKHLIERGDLIPTENRDKRILSKMKLSKLIEEDILSIDVSASFRDLIVLVRKSKRNIFAVLDKHQKLCGLITLDDIRDIMFDPNQNISVEKLMKPPPETIHIGESMQSVMQKFDRAELWSLPIEEEGKYIGFVSKSRIFNRYRELLLGLER